MSTTSNAALLNLMEGLKSDNDGLLEQGIRDLADMAVGPLENVAKKLGLNQTGNLRQIGVYIFTMAAIQESVQLIGIGAGLTKLDFSGFELAQIKQLVEEANRKLDVVIRAPLKVAIDYFYRAIVNLKNQNMAGVIKEMEKVKENAILAYAYAEGQGATLEDLRNGVLAKKLTICSEVLIQSYDGTTITPFILLDGTKKRTIGAMIELDVKNVQNFYESHSIPILALNRSDKANEKENILDGLLRTTYPFLSEGLGLTSSLEPVKFPPYDLRLLQNFLPKGKENAAKTSVGCIEGRPQTVSVWREKEKKKEWAMADVVFDEVDSRSKKQMKKKKERKESTLVTTLSVVGNTKF